MSSAKVVTAPSSRSASALLSRSDELFQQKPAFQIQRGPSARDELVVQHAPIAQRSRRDRQIGHELDRAEASAEASPRLAQARKSAVDWPRLGRGDVALVVEGISRRTWYRRKKGVPMKWKEPGPSIRNRKENHAPHESAYDQRLAPAPSPKLCEVCKSKPRLGQLSRCRDCIRAEADRHRKSRAEAEVRVEAREETKLEAAAQMKRCSTCRTTKSISKFQVWRAAKDGRRQDCKACVEAGANRRPSQLASIPPTLDHEGATQ